MPSGIPTGQGLPSRWGRAPALGGGRVERSAASGDGGLGTPQEGSRFWGSRNGVHISTQYPFRRAGRHSSTFCLPNVISQKRPRLDPGDQHLEMESDQGVQYLGHSRSGGTRKDEQGGGALPARGPSGVALGGRAAPGPLAGPSRAHWSGNDRDLG